MSDRGTTSNAAPMGAPGRTELKAGTLDLSAVLMQSITVVSPGFGLLFGFQFIVSLTGVTSPLAFVLGLALMFLVAIPIAQLAKHVHSAGGYYTYVSRGISPRAGFFTSWLYIIYIPLAPGFAMGFASLIIEHGLKSAYGWTIPWWVTLTALTALIAALSYFGVRLSGRALVIGGALELIIFLALGAWGLASPGKGGLNVTSFNPGNSTSSHGLYLAVVFSILTFLGWESCAPLAEETKNPLRNIPRAIMGAIAVLGFFFLFCTWGLLIGWGTSNVTSLVGSADSPPFVLAKHYWGDLWIITVIALLNSAFALGLGTSNAGARMLYAMARSGTLPRVLARLHPTHGTPIIAIGAITVQTLVMGLGVGKWLGSDQAFFFYGLLSTFAAVFAYGAGSLAVFLFFRRERPDEFNVVTHALCGLVGTLGLVWVLYKSINPLPPSPLRYAPFVFAGWFALGIVILLVMRARGRESWLLQATRSSVEMTSDDPTVGAVDG